ncbi:MAG TPA: ABC transporter ATP-binding protein [Candidatus Lokiarchaeia archaeon]|nr:ABC transporter ATP-binding protein [Candidatus Lokiarchaeia archaeon]
MTSELSNLFARAQTFFFQLRSGIPHEGEMMEYTIEITDLVKRYPTSQKVRHGMPPPPPLGGGPPPGGGPPMGGGSHGGGPLVGIRAILKGSKGPFIEALRKVNLKVKEGEIMGVLGPNGAGKTTLIKILSTMVIHDEGEVIVHGIDVKKEPTKVLKKLQAILPESRGFNWRLTGRQNLEFYALLYGLREVETRERINYLLDLTGMADRADDGYQRYSTGMQRKLLLCRALLRNTPTLLFDEPTAGLDPTAAAEFRNLLVEKLAREEKKTILLSTHNMAEAESICDRITILDKGQVIACDTPENVRYMIVDANIFTVTFSEAAYTEEQAKLVKKLGDISGIHNVTPEVSPDNAFLGISVQVDKNIDIAGIMDPILKSGLKIQSINTQEPTLEDAFRGLTGQYPEQPRRFRGFHGRF